MKKKVFLVIIIFVFLISLNVLSAENCAPSSDIFLDFKVFSELYEVESKYSFPYENREGDSIFLHSIKIINGQKCNLTGATLKIIVKPSEGYIPKDKHPPNHGLYEIRIPTLEPEDVYEIKFKKKGESYVVLNNIILDKDWWHWPILLDREGEWIIYPSLELDKLSGYSHTTYINDKEDIRGFRVYTRSDLEIKDDANLAKILSFIAVSLTLIALIIDIWFRFNTKKEEKKKYNLLKDIYNLLKGSLKQLASKKEMN